MKAFFKKHKYKFIIPLIALALIASGFYTYVQVNPLHTHAATTSTTGAGCSAIKTTAYWTCNGHAHTWKHSGWTNTPPRSDCASCRAIEGYTDCSKCIKSNKVPTGLIACTNSSCDAGKVTCQTCGGNGYIQYFSNSYKSSGYGDTDSGSRITSYEEYSMCQTCVPPSDVNYDAKIYYISGDFNSFYSHQVDGADPSDLPNFKGISSYGIVTCSTCGGDDRVTCSTCGGDGSMNTKCAACNGDGWNTYCTSGKCAYTTDNWAPDPYNTTCYTCSGQLANNCGAATYHAPVYYTCEQSASYTTDASSHWKTCTHCGAKLTDTVANHTYGAAYDDNGIQKRKCTVCSYVETIGPSSYTLTFNPNGGTLSNPGANLNNGTNTNSVTVTYHGGSYWNMNSDIPTRTGYTFTGWFTAASGGTKVYDSAGRCTNEGTYWVGGMWVYTGNVTLYAQYTPNQYEITFNSNGGSFAYYDDVYQDSIDFDNDFFIDSGLYVNEIYDEIEIELKGHTFNGFWDKPEGGEQVWDEDYLSIEGTYFDENCFWIYPGDVTVYAQFIPNTYTITFDANGGDGVSVNSIDCVYGTAVDLASSVAMKNGYIFMGWSTDPDAKVAFESMTMGVSAIESGNDNPVSLDAANITLYAIYSLPTSGVDSVYINYQPTGGNIIQIPFTVDKESMSGNYYLYQEDLFSIYGEGNGTVYAKDKAGNVTQIGDPFALPEPETPGPVPPTPDPTKYTQTIIYYIYDYETSVKNGTDVYTEIGSFSQEVIENGTFKPMWAEEALADNETTINLLQNYNKKSITKEEEYIVTEDCTIKAYYYPKSYNVTFVLPYNDTVIVGSPSTTIYYNTHYGLLPLPTAAGNNHNGYIFKGWKDADGNSITDATLFTGATDVTLCAQMDVAEFTVTYDYGTNGGTDVTVESAKVKYGQSISLTPTAIKAVNGQDWVFIGWNTDSEATTGLSTLTMPAEDITIYAIYKCTLTGTFHQANGTIKTVSKTIYNNAKEVTITFPLTVTKAGWESVGWTIAKTVSEKAEFTAEGRYTISTNTEYYARYKKKVTLYYDTQTDDISINGESKIILYNSSGTSTVANYTVHSAISKEKHSFKYWTTENRMYNPNSTISITEDTTLTAIWDKYPEIMSGDNGGSVHLQDLYYPLKDANNGVITEAEILSYVKATDNEDGEIVVTLEDFNAEEFKSLTSDAKILITYRATDSYGNFVTSSIYVYVIATQIEAPTMYVDNRFITSEYFKNENTYIPYSQGGLNTTSLWITDQQYNNVITNALQNMDAEEKEYESTYYFSKNKIQEVKEYTKTNGLGNFKALDALEKFILDFFS